MQHGIVQDVAQLSLHFSLCVPFQHQYLYFIWTGVILLETRLEIWGTCSCLTSPQQQLHQDACSAERRRLQHAFCGGAAGPRQRAVILLLRLQRPGGGRHRPCAAAPHQGPEPRPHRPLGLCGGATHCTALFWLSLSTRQHVACKGALDLHCRPLNQHHSCELTSLLCFHCARKGLAPYHEPLRVSMQHASSISPAVLRMRLHLP